MGRGGARKQKRWTHSKIIKLFGSQVSRSFFFILMFNLLSINIRGFNSGNKVTWIRDLCGKEKPIFCGVQETKLMNTDDFFVSRWWYNNNFAWAQLNAVGSAGGLILAWDSSRFTGQHAHGEDGILAVIGKLNGINNIVGIMNVYGPRDEKNRGRLWDRIQSIINSVDACWCIFGDFNEVRRLDERFNSNFNERSARVFNDFITRNNLTEIALGGRKFTRVSDDGIKFSKLDRFLVDEGFKGLWNNLSAIVMDRGESDHCPILLRNKVVNYGPKPFRFFDVWLKEADFIDIVKRAWTKDINSTTPDRIFRDRLKSVKEDLKIWSRVKFGKIDKDIDRLGRVVKELELEAENRSLNIE